MVQVFSLSIVYATRSFLVSMSESVFALDAMPYLYERRGLSSPSSICDIRGITCLLDIIIMGRCNFYDAGPRPFKMTSWGIPKAPFTIVIYRATKEKQ